MSRTDKTRPLWVKAMDSPGNFAEVHDHRDGRECGLPARPEPPPWRNAGCYWTYTADFWASGAARCGCSLCHGCFWEEADKRSARRRTKLDTRQYARVYRNGLSGEESEWLPSS